MSSRKKTRISVIFWFKRRETLKIVFGIAFVVARDIQRWRDQTEFLEDIMQVLGDKEQN